MSPADRLLADLRALLAEFRSPENGYWLTSACADRLEAVLTEHAPQEEEKALSDVTWCYGHSTLSADESRICPRCGQPLATHTWAENWQNGQRISERVFACPPAAPQP